MNIVQVWAPKANSVELVINHERLAMRQGERGWWSLKTPLAAPGADYAFSINHGDALPDPRSPFQPGGVHGPSRFIDQGKFRWTDSGWSAPPLGDGVVYELHIGTFTAAGTFASAIERLGHLV
ncbi:MAG: malto-oligosyltrehalose trehalohydrolase, partial [Candidatus Binataceae bacterium]